MLFIQKGHTCINCCEWAQSMCGLIDLLLLLLWALISIPEIIHCYFRTGPAMAKQHSLPHTTASPQGWSWPTGERSVRLGGGGAGDWHSRCPFWLQRHRNQRTELPYHSHEKHQKLQKNSLPNTAKLQLSRKYSWSKKKKRALVVTFKLSLGFNYAWKCSETWNMP